MILLFNHIPVSIDYKVKKLVERAISEYGSDFYDIEGQRWKGDQLTVQALFPDWILKENNDSSDVVIVNLVKNYLRWLMSVEHGYGSNPEWSTIRDPNQMNAIFLEALAEFYFPGADFGSSPLSTVLPNIRKFSILADSHYFDKKGTPEAIKYVLTSLFDQNYDTTEVIYSNPGIIRIVSSLNSSYKSFINEHVIPAGMIVLYE
jgi:hypothetical protein